MDVAGIRLNSRCESENWPRSSVVEEWVLDLGPSVVEDNRTLYVETASR